MTPENSKEDRQRQARERSERIQEHREKTMALRRPPESELLPVVHRGEEYAVLDARGHSIFWGTRAECIQHRKRLLRMPEYRKH